MSNFRDRILEGLEGKYSGLNNGLNRANKYIFGLQRSCYYLLGGMSGSAKTTLADFMLINAIKDADSKGIPINVFYYSLEIDEITKKANWLSVLIYQKYDIIITPEKIKGLGDFRLSNKELELVNSELEELDKIWNKINWIWESINPTGIYKNLWSFFDKRGKFTTEPYEDEFKNTKERIVKYTLNNPEEYNILVIDHIALLKIEKRDNKHLTLKENLDKQSEYCVTLRNLFGLTSILVQQFNQGLSSVDRAKFKGVDISPQQNDFKDSTSPYQDADVVLGLMNAYKMDMESCIGYSISNTEQSYQLRDRFRLLKILKNRLSRDNISIGLLFQAEGGHFEELLKPNEFSQEYINKINNLVNNR